MSENNESINTNELSMLSKVAFSVNKRVFNKASMIVLLSVIFLVVSVFYVATKGHDRHRKDDIVSNANTNPYTLQENLTALERMQALEAQKSVRAPNYTATTDGNKIGNPRAFREEPATLELEREMAVRMNAPTTFINIDEPLANNGRKNPELAANATPMIASHDANGAFLNAKNSIEQVDAAALSHPDYMLGAGEFIPATLETAIQSELPGMVRALTTRDVYALTGNRILIPKGSRLIGQYSSGSMDPSQARVLISWTRVQLPNGIVATLNSPSSDALGRAGQGADSIDTHFFERFSTGFLYSILGATTAFTGVNPDTEYNSASAYRIAAAGSLQQSASDSLHANRNIQPTLHIDQGAQINVFVARDVSFFNVARR
jgi:type IV secretion system protein VirB10